MLTETYFASVAGPPLANNTSIAKDAGIYEHTLHPSHSTTHVFKKSSVPRNCLAVGQTHVFAAQQDKSTVHVYSRLKGNQEAIATFQEKIRSVALVGQVLVLGTEEGRVMIWEAVTCIAATPFHLLTGSDDSNVHVWSLAHLLELESSEEPEPEQTLSGHRAAITSLAVAPSVNPDTNMCVSAGNDKSCIVWNYQTGVALRTLLFLAPPTSICLDPCARALYVSSKDGSMFAVELFGEQALVGPQSAEASSTPVQVSSAFGSWPAAAGAASCLTLNYDGTVMLSGHTGGQIRRWDLGGCAGSTELADLNASVTNIVFESPFPSTTPTRSVTVVKPFMGSRHYNFAAQFETDLTPETRFARMLDSKGLPHDVLETAILALQEPHADVVGDEELRKENESLWEIINEQRALQKKTLERYKEVKYTKTSTEAC